LQWLDRQHNQFCIYGSNFGLSEFNLPEKAGCIHKKDPLQCGYQEAKLCLL